MPDLNDSNKEKRRFRWGVRDRNGARKGLVTFGARKMREGLPISIEISEQ
jgi:hypothetical protein